MTADSPDFDDPSRADDVGGPGDTLGPTEATDPDELRNRDGDEVVDPPDHWFAADRLAGMYPWERASLNYRLAAEEPDFFDRHRPRPTGADDFAPPDIFLNTRRHRGQIDGTPEDGLPLFPVIDGPAYPPWVPQIWPLAERRFPPPERRQ